jgi:hypothetical protein
MNRVLSESVVYRMVTEAGRTIAGGARRLDRALGRVPLPPPDPDDEARARKVIASSRIVGWIDRALDIPGRAWRSSMLRRILRPSIAHVESLTAAERLRLLAHVLLAAAVTHIVLVLVFAEPVGWPTWTAWIVFLAAAGVAALWPRETVAAWKDSAVRRWLRRGSR